MKLKWQQAPVKTQWGDDIVLARLAIQNDHTVCLYCERDQTAKVETMFAQRTWVGLTEKDKEHLSDLSADPRWNAWIGMEQTEAKLKEKNT